MGLQIWLSLNGNLNNQGLTDVDITSSDITYISGKIGNAANFSSSYIGINNTPITGDITDFSFAFWMKTSSPSNSMCLYNGRTTIGGACAIFAINGTFRFDDGAQHTLSYTIPSDTWEHYCFTRNASNIKLYVNGILKVTVESTSFTCEATKATIGQSSTNATVGNGSNCFVGQLNDFRIYDEAISPKQVKLLSQGLVCHYPMGNIDGKIGGRNLLQNSQTLINYTLAEYLTDESANIFIDENNNKLYT